MEESKIYFSTASLVSSVARLFARAPLPEAGQAIRYLAQSVFSIMPKEDFSVESVLRIAAQLVSRKGVKVLVVDPFNRFEHQIPDWETETQYISRIFDEFSNFAVKHKVLLILVAHPTKLRREPGSKRWPVPTLYDINGSAAFFNKTDYDPTLTQNGHEGLRELRKRYSGREEIDFSQIS